MACCRSSGVYQDPRSPPDDLSNGRRLGNRWAIDEHQSLSDPVVEGWRRITPFVLKET